MTDREIAISVAGIAAFFWGTRFVPDDLTITMYGAGVNCAILVVASLIALSPKDP